MDKKIGMIGCGNMGGAMIGGMLSSGVCTPSDIIASDVSEPMRRSTADRYGIFVTEDNTAVAEAADLLVLAVKPQYYEEVIKEIRRFVREETIVVTIAPGKTLLWLRECFGRDVKLIRTMPNTPAQVGCGMMGLCPGEGVSSEDVQMVCRLFCGFTETEVVPEKLLDVVTAVSGSSPAYVFLFIEAMADAAVSGGMPRDQAYHFAAQAVYGSAKMVLETKKHPAELKDMVCSPGGTTIEAVRVLEEKGFRSAVIEAMEACMDVSRTM